MKSKKQAKHCNKNCGFPVLYRYRAENSPSNLQVWYRIAKSKKVPRFSLWYFSSCFEVLVCRFRENELWKRQERYLICQRGGRVSMNYDGFLWSTWFLRPRGQQNLPRSIKQILTISQVTSSEYLGFFQWGLTRFMFFPTSLVLVHDVLHQLSVVASMPRLIVHAGSVPFCLGICPSEKRKAKFLGTPSLWKKTRQLTNDRNKFHSAVGKLAFLLLPRLSFRTRANILLRPLYVRAELKTGTLQTAPSGCGANAISERLLRLNECGLRFRKTLCSPV